MSTRAYITELSLLERQRHLFHLDKKHKPSLMPYDSVQGASILSKYKKIRYFENLLDESPRGGLSQLSGLCGICTPNL